MAKIQSKRNSTKKEVIIEKASRLFREKGFGAASMRDLAEHVGITEANVSLLKHGRVKGVRFETLERICEFLDCQPGDILKYEKTPH